MTVFSVTRYKWMENVTGHYNCKHSVSAGEFNVFRHLTMLKMVGKPNSAGANVHYTSKSGTEC